LFARRLILYFVSKISSQIISWDYFLAFPNGLVRFARIGPSQVDILEPIFKQGFLAPPNETLSPLGPGIPFWQFCGTNFYHTKRKRW